MSGVALVEPREGVARGRFNSVYLIKKGDRYALGRAQRRLRLLDCMKAVVDETDPDYLGGANVGEFAVVDVVTREKAYFEQPEGYTPELISEMVESHFASRAFRVGHRLWFV